MNVESIWQEYSNKLRALLYSKISNSADVDDLLQEILLKTHQQIGTLQSRDKLKPWLFTLANNTVIDFYRREGRKPAVEESDLWFSGTEPLAQEQLSECVIPFISALPEQSAELLQAVDIEGWSQKEYAQELGIGYSTLKSRVQRARVQLRHLFDECCHLELARDGTVMSYERKGDRCSNC